MFSSIRYLYLNQFVTLLLLGVGEVLSVSLNWHQQGGCNN